MGKQGTVLVVLLFALTALSPLVAAHEPDADDFIVAAVTDEDYTVDGAITDDAWDDVDGSGDFNFDSADSGDVDVQMVWHVDDEKLLVSIEVEDDGIDLTGDFVDFAFAEDHANDDADNGDQSILRVNRDGDTFEIDVEDPGDFDSTTDTGAPSGFDLDVVSDASGWTIELAIDWDNAHGGFGIWAYSDEADPEEQSGGEVYPDAADLDDPGSWADVKVELTDADVTITTSRTTGKVGETVDLTADMDDEDADIVNTATFERSADGTTWTSIGSKSFDSSGKAKLVYTLPTAGVWKFRATTPEKGTFAAGVSNVVTVTVADISSFVSGGEDAWAKYEAQTDGQRNYTLTANTSSGTYATWEASFDGTSWFRLSTGGRGSQLATRWTPPTTGEWNVRPVTYTREGAATVGDVIELDAYTISSTKTASTTVLDAEEDAGKIKLTATVEPTAAPGTVTFYKETGATLGTASLVGGKASFTVQSPLPGTHTYAARYGGSTTHAPSSGAETISWWPAMATSPRTTDATGEAITVTHAAGAIAFAARKGDGPGIPGAVEILATFNGTTTTVFQGNVPGGSASVPYAPKAEGVYLLEARFYRESGATVAADVRTASIEIEDRAVTLKLTFPTKAEEGDTLTATVAFEDGSGKPLTVDGGSVKIQQLVGETWTSKETKAAVAATSVTLTLPAPAPGAHSFRAIYTGAEGFQPGTSSVTKLTVTPVDDGDTTDDGTDGPAPTPIPWMLVLVAAGLAAFALRRK